MSLVIHELIPEFWPLLADASRTYEAEIPTVLGAAHSTDEQQRLRHLATRPLAAAEDGELP